MQFEEGVSPVSPLFYYLVKGSFTYASYVVSSRWRLQHPEVKDRHIGEARPSLSSSRSPKSQARGQKQDNWVTPFPTLAKSIIHTGSKLAKAPEMTT